jgi:hypothetical protein
LADGDLPIGLARTTRQHREEHEYDAFDDTDE